MSREVRRVPLTFIWPLNKVWTGYLTPEHLHEAPCDTCDGRGWPPTASRLADQWYGNAPFDPADTGSTPYTPDHPVVRAVAQRNIDHSPEYYGQDEAAITREARRLADLFNKRWMHHLDQDDLDALLADGRLHEFTHTWTKGEGWKPIEPPPVITPQQVNDWSLTGFGHSSGDQYRVVRAKCERLGEPVECAECDGHGSLERWPGQRAEAGAWQPVQPPAGEGWQYWETVSEGSPISPVFPTADALSEWLQTSYRSVGGGALTKEQADNMIRVGWAPSFIGDGTGIHAGDTVVGP